MNDAVHEMAKSFCTAMMARRDRVLREFMIGPASPVRIIEKQRDLTDPWDVSDIWAVELSDGSRCWFQNDDFVRWSADPPSGNAFLMPVQTVTKCAKCGEVAL